MRVSLYLSERIQPMCDQEPEKRRRMQVQLLVGIAVMVAMMRRPPEHAFLRGRHGHECDNELKRAAGLKRTVRKITVITGGNEKHAHEDDRQSGDDVIPMK